jgi:hypothetical protein
LVFNGAEMRALPAHFANDTYVNGTNYWRMISAGFYAPSLDIITSIPFAGPPNGNDGPANSLDETLKAYDKLADPDYDSAVTAGALALVVLIVFHNAWLLFLLNRGRAWVKSATAKEQAGGSSRAKCEHSMNAALDNCGSFCGMGVLIGKVFNLSPPQDVQELVARKSRVAPTEVPEARVVATPVVSGGDPNHPYGVATGYP